MKMKTVFLGVVVAVWMCASIQVASATTIDGLTVSIDGSVAIGSIVSGEITPYDDRIITFGIPRDNQDFYAFNVDATTGLEILLESTQATAALYIYELNPATGGYEMIASKFPSTYWYDEATGTMVQTPSNGIYSLSLTGLIDPGTYIIGVASGDSSGTAQFNYDLSVDTSCNLADDLNTWDDTGGGGEATQEFPWNCPAVVDVFAQCFVEATNHGEYVSCVARAAHAADQADTMSRVDRIETTVNAAQRKW